MWRFRALSNGQDGVVVVGGGRRRSLLLKVDDSEYVTTPQGEAPGGLAALVWVITVRKQSHL